jgi:hypothetical protein
MFNVKFTCASAGEKAQTIRTSQFEGYTFRKGQHYRLVLSNGTVLNAVVNRADGSTLYITAENFPSGLKRAGVGSPVSRKIKSIKKVS